MTTGTLAEFDLDLHLHSRHSISCSPDMGLEALAAHAPVKGLDGLGTGDCLHPGWLRELEAKLEGRDGAYRFEGTAFFLQSEVETLHGGRIHHLLLFEDFASVHEMRRRLRRHGAAQLDSRGRPQLAIPPAELLRHAQGCGALCGPAHAFTPYLGAYAHQVSIQDCYGALPPFLELGLSADTPVASGIRELAGVPFLTASDAHSPQTHRIGREFTRFRLRRPGFRELVMALAGQGGRGIALNVGLDVREGKYHRSGCVPERHLVDLDTAIARLQPAAGQEGPAGLEEALRRLGRTRCPECGGRVKVGVRDRIALLSDAPFTDASGGAPTAVRGPTANAAARPPYLHVVPLAEVIAGVLGVASADAKRVQLAYHELVVEFGPEKRLLLDLNLGALAGSRGTYASAVLRRSMAAALGDFRAGRIPFAEEGHSGVYGRVDFGRYRGI